MEYPNIRSLREDHDFRQCDLASVLHVSQNTSLSMKTALLS